MLQIFVNVDQINNSLAKNLNGIPIESIRAMVLSETPKIKAKIVQGTIDRVNEIVRTNTFNGNKKLPIYASVLT